MHPPKASLRAMLKPTLFRNVETGHLKLTGVRRSGKHYGVGIPLLRYDALRPVLRLCRRLRSNG
jgi:hypothetical protein